MSETTTDTSVSRPWHGSDSPFEALHDWMIKELDAIKTAVNPTIKALEARIAELETTTMTPAPMTPPRVEPATYSAALDNPVTQSQTSGLTGSVTSGGTAAPSAEPAV